MDIIIFLSQKNVSKIQGVQSWNLIRLHILNQAHNTLIKYDVNINKISVLDISLNTEQNIQFLKKSFTYKILLLKRTGNSQCE